MPPRADRGRLAPRMSISQRSVSTSATRRRAASAASAAARAARAYAPVINEARSDQRGAGGRGGSTRRAGRGGARAAAQSAAHAGPVRDRKRARSADAGEREIEFSSGEDTDISVGLRGGEEDPSSEDTSDGEAGAPGAQVGGAGGAGAPRVARLPAALSRPLLATVTHVLKPLRVCTYGCGAMVYPEEGTTCCSAGKYILGPEFNPPIDDAFLEILELPHISHDSRLLNSALAMGSQGVFPSRAMGGLGFVHHDYGHYFLMGKTYLILRPVGSNNAFDNYLLPDNLLLDGAAHDLGGDYAARLLRTRAYLAEHHPLARHLTAIAEVPGPRVDLNPYMRMEAHSLRTNAMELAHVSSGVQGQGGAVDRANKVVYFDMRLHEQGLTPVTVDRRNALYDLLMFPLVHEKGVGGYFYGNVQDGDYVKSSTGVKMSLQFYVRAMMFQNRRLHYLGRLAQEYALVQYSRMVEDTLAFQRSDKLQRYFKRRRDMNPARPAHEDAGSRVGLTASVVGSRSYQQAQIDDSCAVAHAHGSGTFFITFTCNPNWPEITAALLPGQKWTDRADVVNRVFHAKFKAFIEDLRKGTFFQDKNGKPWKAKWIMYVIEFQKRGKPHGHVVVRLAGRDEDQPRTGADVDKFISARMPVVERDCACSACSAGNKAECLQKRKLAAVQKHMIHKCAVGVCMSKEEPRVCKRGYGKAPCAHTTHDEGGFPIYKRGVGDEFVVPHNADMLLRYDCHINVELCSSVWVHKYMHNYMHKGQDSIRMVTKDVYKFLKGAGYNMDDEVLKIQTFRYLSAGEAICRLNGYNLSQSSVGCTRLSVHLEGEDWVGDGAAAVTSSSTLLDYFKRPAALVPLLYLQYYSKHTVQKATPAEVLAGAGGVLVHRRRGNDYYVDGLGNKVSVRSAGCLHVARMYAVSVTRGEQYYLRALLTCVPATSFEGLRTVGDTMYPTYREAAEARGLLSVEREFADALGIMTKGLGTNLATVADLRHTFVMMAVQGGEGVPVLELYRQFSYIMALDIDVSGAISPPGMDKGAVRVRLPVPADYEITDDYSLADFPVHEYHLLRLLDGLLQRNFSRTLEDLGLPSLRAHVAARREGAAAPFLQLMLEGYLYAKPGAEDALYPAQDRAVAPAVRAAAARPPAIAQLHLLRATYVNNYPELLTGEHLAHLLLEAEHLGQIGHEAAFFRDIDVGAEEASFNAMYDTLNPEQKTFVDKACRGLQHQVARREALKNRTPVPAIPDDECYYHLQARGGRGKSYVTKCIIAKALHLRLMVCVSSFAGVAAILLPLGQTCHKTYGLQLETTAPAPSTLTTGSAQGLHLAEAVLHIIDECDCLHKHLFEAASNVTMRCVNARWGIASTKPFGGSMVLIVGDKHQTLPITKGIVNDDIIINSMMRASAFFSYFSSSELTIAQRSKDDAAYDAWLGLLSVNRAPGPVEVKEDEEPPTLRRVYIPEQCFKTTSLDDALVWLFGPVPPPEGPFPELNPRHALLAMLNETVDTVNELVLDRYVGGPAIILEAAHEAAVDSLGNAPEDGISRTHATLEYMRGVKQSGVPSATLRLKKGCILLLTRNMLASLGLVNGTRLRLLSDAPPEGETMSLLHVETVGLGEPTRHFIPRIIFELTTPGGLKFVRRQFPVRLAYALTGNKAQGQTVIRSVFDSRHESFAHGTAYVANSRTTSFATLGFLHAPLAEGARPGERPTFVNYVLQRALAGGVLVGAPRARAQERGAVELGSEGEEEESEEEEEEEMARAPPRAARQRAPPPASRPATFQRDAFTLTARRTDTHERVVGYYE